MKKKKLLILNQSQRKLVCLLTNGNIKGNKFLFNNIHLNRRYRMMKFAFILSEIGVPLEILNSVIVKKGVSYV